MILLQGIVSSMVGAIALSVLTLLFHSLFFRRALWDGQYARVFFVTVPVGIEKWGVNGEEPTERQMMNEKPQKRLVSRNRFLQIMEKKWTLYSASALLSSLVLVIVCGVPIHLYRHAIAPPPNYTCSPYERNYLLEGGELCVFLFLLTKMSVCIRKRGEAIAPVGLLTERNAHLLPPEETLVRASAVSPAQLQDELLRAAQYGIKTHAEQLLRAGKVLSSGKESRQDV